MNRIVVILLMVAAVSAAQISASTVTGSVGKDGARTWVFEPATDGQTLITLNWTGKPARLFMVLVCEAEGELELFGVGAAAADRVQRIEAGILGDSCIIGVSSFKGSSKFNLNLQSSVGNALSPVRTTSPRLVSIDAAEVPMVQQLLARLANRNG